MRVGAALLLVEMLLASAASAASFSEGSDAYSQNHVADAERIYTAVIADPSASAADRSGAERELARIGWLIDGDSKRALADLAAAKAVGDKPCDTAAMIARVLRESKEDANAIGSGEALLASCPEPSGRDDIRTHLIGARLDLAARDAANRSSLLAGAVAEAKQFTIDASVEAARVRFETALMTDDATGALAAWKDYFWLDDSDAPQALENTDVAAIFN